VAVTHAASTQRCPIQSIGDLMANLTFISFPVVVPPIPTVPGFASTTVAAGSSLFTPGNNVIPVTIPAGVDVMFGIVAELLGRDVTPGASTRQSVYYSVVRDALGALAVSSSATNQTQRSGSGINIPQNQGISILDANTVELNFNNALVGNARVNYSVAITGPHPAF
jgi:hypothetical protein